MPKLTPLDFLSHVGLKLEQEFTVGDGLKYRIHEHRAGIYAIQFKNKADKEWRFWSVHLDWLLEKEITVL